MSSNPRRSPIMVGISAVIPCYNAKREYISGALNSVLAQTFQDYEVILVDDGSLPKYQEILLDAAQKDHRIRLITQEHKGTSAARNLGVEEATGKYIIFIDADDYAFPWHFQEAFRIAEETQAEIVYAYECCGRSADIPVQHKPDPKIVQKDDHWLASNFIGKSSYLDDKMYFGRASYSRIIRREGALKTKFQEGVAIGEDILWNLAILENTSKRYVVESAWYIYIIREDSITQKYNPDMNECLKPFYQKLGPYVEKDESLRQDYIDLIINDLKKLIFGCYLGHPENQDSFLKRWSAFNQICKQPPWSHLSAPRQGISVPGERLPLYFPLWSIKQKK